ncbi:hypothetical protein LINPERHAP2_LOCUS20592 [Linum perenne]
MVQNQIVVAYLHTTIEIINMYNLVRNAQASRKQNSTPLKVYTRNIQPPFTL